MKKINICTHDYFYRYWRRSADQWLGPEGREKAIQNFKLDPVETEERHHLTFDTYESGKISLSEYLKRLVFYTKRNFTEEDFRKFMFDQSQPFPEMLALIRGIKEKYGIKIAVVSNEGRELNNHRINTFKLGEFVDFFISSCFVHFRKPDADIFKVALDIAQVSAGKSDLPGRPSAVCAGSGYARNPWNHSPGFQYDKETTG